MTRIALAQINPAVGDLKNNEKKISEYIARARKAGAAIVLFPELAVTGYPPEDLLFKSGFVREAEKTLDRIAAATDSICAIVGYPAMHEGLLYNAAALIENGKVIYTAHKYRLPNYGVFDEKRYFAQGAGTEPVAISGLNLAVTICEDIWVIDGPPADTCARRDVDLIVNLSSSPFHIGKTELRRNIARDWAAEFGKPLAYCNLVGGQDELVFDGGSFICDSAGNVAASAAEFAEDLLLADIQGGGNAGVEISGGKITPPLPYPENAFEALKIGTRDYVQKNGFEKVLIALSGGIDSALTASVAVAALGPGRVRGIAMPSVYSSESSLKDARELAESHGIRFDVIPISSLMESFEGALKGVFHGTEPGIAEENIQARIRGTLIMALSNKFGYLVLTTGNKSEVSVGYCTLYGDMAGGFAVIKDLPKQKVYDLCRWINSTGTLPRIPESTLEKEPSAELRPNQKDSDSLPPYAELDPILKLYVEDEKSIEEIISLGYSEPVVKKVARLVDLNEYKRRQGPPGIRITPKAFGKDRRFPITNRFFEWEDR